MADTFDPHHLELTKALRPGQEAAVTDAGGRHGVVAQGPAELIGRVCDMKMLVGIDPDGDLWDTGWRGGCHCGPSDVAVTNMSSPVRQGGDGTATGLLVGLL